METSKSDRKVINFAMDEGFMLDSLDDMTPIEGAEVKRFREIATEIANTFARKNNDYGNAFEQSVDKLGIVAGVTPIFNKCNRLITLAKGTESLVKSESLADTLRDMAAYCIMLEMTLEKRMPK